MLTAYQLIFPFARETTNSPRLWHYLHRDVILRKVRLCGCSPLQQRETGRPLVIREVALSTFSGGDPSGAVMVGRSSSGLWKHL
jgi:hypothetical protein